MGGPIDAPRTSTLTVPGASLHYEVRGAGPVLLLIVGGNGDGGTFAPVADALADRYTVVTYDRRGFFRSPVDGPVDDEQRLTADADDADRLLAHLGGEPAHVFGSSSGALVALDLLTRHPERIRTVIAHEPPAVMLLADSERHLAVFEEVYRIYRRDGVQPAMERFVAHVGLGGLPQRAQAAQASPQTDMMSRIRRNMEFWLEHELRTYPRYVPDVDALRRAGPRLVLAGGRESRDQMAYLPNTVLADRLGREVVEFPGGHVGYMTHPAEFAPRLAEVLAG